MTFTFLNVRFLRAATAAKGQEHAVTTGGFQEVEFHWPLSSHEFEARTVAIRPIAVTPWQQWERLKSGINQPSKIEDAFHLLPLPAT